MAKVLQSQLILSLVDRVTAPARGIQAQMDRLNARIAATNEQASNVGGKLAVAAAQATGFALALAQPMSAAMSLEDKMADIAKVSDMSAAQLQAFEGALRHMARSEIPLAVEELAELAAAASASGIADTDLEAFTRQVAQSAVAWEVSGQYAGENLAKIKTALGMTIPETARYADAINFLSDATASSAPDLVEFARRVAADGKVAGFSNEQVLALGATMVSMGAEADVAATSLRNAQKALTRGAGATDRQAGAFMKLGLRAETVAKAMPNDAMGQFLEVLSRINKLEQHERISVMSDLFGDEARALMPLLGELEKVREVTAAVADETNYMGSVQKEFQQRAKTGRYALQKFRNQVRDIGISIGQSLLPAMKEILERLSPILLAVADWTAQNPRLVATIISLTGALVGLRLALLALRFAGLTGKAGVLNLLALGMGTVGRAGAALGNAVRESIRLQAALAAMDGTKIGLFTRLGAALRGLAAVTGLRLVATAIGAVASAIAAVSAPVWLGIAVAVAAVGAAWKYWDRLTAILGGVADAIGTALQPAMEGVRKWMEPAEPIIRRVGEAFGYLGEKIGAAWDIARNLVGGLFTREILTEGEQADLRARASKMTTDLIAYFAALPGQLMGIGGEMIQKLWDGMKARFQTFIEWVKTIPTQIADAIGDFDPLANVRNRLSGWWGGEPEQAKAVGGHMRARVPTLVGERGPEMIYPSRAGWVAHANQAKRLADLSRRTRPASLPSRPARSEGGRPVNVTFGNIVIQGGANASARDISREIGRTVQAELRGTFTDPY